MTVSIISPSVVTYSVLFMPRLLMTISTTPTRVRTPAMTRSSNRSSFAVIFITLFSVGSNSSSSTVPPILRSWMRRRDASTCSSDSFGTGCSTVLVRPAIVFLTISLPPFTSPTESTLSPAFTIDVKPASFPSSA